MRTQTRWSVRRSSLCSLTGALIESFPHFEPLGGGVRGVFVDGPQDRSHDDFTRSRSHVSGGHGGHREGRAPCVRGCRPAAGAGKRRDTADTNRISSAERFVSVVSRLFLPRAARHRGHTMAASLFSCRGCGDVWASVSTSVRLCASSARSVLYGSVVLLTGALFELLPRLEP